MGVLECWNVGVLGAQYSIAPLLRLGLCSSVPGGLNAYPALRDPCPRARSSAKAFHGIGICGQITPSASAARPCLLENRQGLVVERHARRQLRQLYRSWLIGQLPLQAGPVPISGLTRFVREITLHLALYCNGAPEGFPGQPTSPYPIAGEVPRLPPIAGPPLPDSHPCGCTTHVGSRG